MSSENKNNFVNCRSTSDFLRFSEENSIVDRQSAEQFLLSNTEIPFVIRKCQYSDNAQLNIKDVYAVSKCYGPDRGVINTLIRAELDSPQYFKFHSTTHLTSYGHLDTDVLVWVAVDHGPDRCWFSELR